MKKLNIILILFVLTFAVKTNVFAASGSLSVSSSSVYVGDSFTVSVGVTSAAAWNVHVNASGPVKDCSIKQADATADAMDTNKTFKATCTATGEGTITLRLSGDVTSASDGESVDVSGTKTVKVSKKTVSKPSNPSNSKPQTTQPSNSNNNKPANNASTNNNKTPVNNLSTNNNIKSLSIDGYELVKVDNNNYTLTVAKDVTSVSVNATAEDSKAKVTGTGVHKLQVGENNIKLIITSESGAQKTINIKVTRKDGYYLDDLESILKNDKLQEADIIISADSKISKEDINKIKNSQKTLRLNYYDQNKKLVYSWLINGKEINDSKEFTTAVTYTAENEKEIYKLSNYADGLYISFKHNGDLPTGIKLKLYIGNKFENESFVNVYHYNDSQKILEIVKDNLKVIDGYIEFNVEDCSEHFVTMSNIGVITKEDSSSVNIFMIFAIIELIAIIALVAFIFIKLKQNKKEKLDIEDNVNMTVSDMVEEELDKSELSLFGNSDEPIQEKVYEVKETIEEEKIEVIEPITEENKAEEPKKLVYCPQCEAPLAEYATTCFLCGKKL